jgi:tetratricopeptide (TPR) repeat protein
MSDAIEEARELIAQAGELPSTSPQRVDLLEAAARYAESAGDLELAYDARDRVIDAGTGAGEPQKALVAFAWCLAMCDQEPERFPESKLHWRFKWILQTAPQFPEISREQLDGLLTDVERRFAKLGSGKGAAHKLRAYAAEYLGDDEELERACAAWKAAPRDSLSDCHACDLDTEVDFLVRLGKDEAALKLAREIVRRNMRCWDVPTLTYARALPSLLRTGDVETAQTWQRRGYPMLKRMKKKVVGSAGEHLAYCAVTGDTARGLRILRETLPLAAEHSLASTQLTYLAGAYLTLERAARGKGRVTLKLPESFGGSGSSEKHAADALGELLLDRARSIAARFDRRNDNTRISRWLDEWVALRELSLEAPNPNDA